MRIEISNNAKGFLTSILSKQASQILFDKLAEAAKRAESLNNTPGCQYSYVEATNNYSYYFTLERNNHDGWDLISFKQELNEKPIIQKSPRASRRETELRACLI